MHVQVQVKEMLQVLLTKKQRLYFIYIFTLSVTQKIEALSAIATDRSEKSTYSVLR